MEICSTSAYKVRMVKKEDREYRINYLKAIAEDQLFRKYYTIKGVSIKRAIIVFMLYHKLFFLLSSLI